MLAKNGSSEGSGGGSLPPLPPDAVIIVPVRNTVLFPGLVVPITLGRPKSAAAAQQAVREQRQVGILLQREAAVDDPTAIDMHRMGTLANVLRFLTAPDGTHHVVCQGEQRFQIVEYLSGWPFMVARVLRIPEPDTRTSEIEARFVNLKAQAVEAIELLPQVPADLLAAIQSIETPPALADLATAYMDVKPEEKQEILETVDLAARMDKVSRMLAHRIEILRLSQEIGRQTKAVARRAAARSAAARTDGGDPEAARRRRGRQGGRDRRAGKGHHRSRHAEGGRGRRAQGIAPAAEDAGRRRRIRHGAHLSRLADRAAVEAARGKADRHQGRPPHPRRGSLRPRQDQAAHHRVSRRAQACPAGKAPILCFVGPPGVGKTSLGQSIARAMDRKFVRVSLGGVHDEAEIRGHRRTYIGALPGNIIQAIRKAGSRNCVMMLDEIDKLGAGFHGDPGAALLEVLDPEQNNTFRDNYLAVPFDLSRVVFITTANMLDTVPGPLRDRMEIISLAGYTADEKLQIAHRYLVKRQLEANGLKAGQVEIDDDALREVIQSYTREAGVRSLERAIGQVLRNAAVRIAEGQSGPIRVSARRSRADPRRAAVRERSGDADQHSRRGHRARLDAGRRRHFVHRGDADSRLRAAHSHRAARRGDEGKRAGCALHRQEPRGGARHRSERASRRATSTSTCRRAPSRRTGRARASPCSWR